MSSLSFALIVFGCTSAAALFGVLLGKLLPAHHLDGDSKDTIKLVMGLIATISALVLSLLIASANSSFNTQQQQLESFAIDVVQLDRILNVYGPDAQETRALLRQAVQAARTRMTSNGKLGMTHDMQIKADKFAIALHALSPRTDIQQYARTQAFQLALSILRTRLLMSDSAGGAISWPFLAVLIGWLCVLFTGFGLLTRFNATSAAALMIGAFSVSAAIFLILELDEPYGGLISLSDLPLRQALGIIGGPVL